MLIEIQFKLANLIKLGKWEIWRIMNSIVILFSFFIPWVWEKEGPVFTFTGFRILDFYQYMARFEVFEQEIELTERVRIALGLGQHFIGLYAILIYCALNLFFAIHKPQLINKPVWITSVLCLIALGIRSLWVTPFLDEGLQGLSFTSWGYWLVLIGLVSSIVLEIAYSIFKRD